MSWLFFQDESGHDHKSMPLEVRGGIALHTSKLWRFIQELQRAELDCFGVRLNEHGSEIKGSKLLDSKRCKWALQEETLDDTSRKNGVRRFLAKSQQHEAPSQREFTSFGQASKLMANRVFLAMKQHDAVIFASAIPPVKPPKDYEFQHYLRKDLIFMHQRFFWFLESKQEYGLLVLDQVEKETDKKYLKRVEDYYTKTEKGKKRSKWIVPYPLFVDSQLSFGAQAADLCLYCINWGFRRPEWGFSGPIRQDIQQEFAGLCGQLQFKGESVEDGKLRRLFGIQYVSDPYTARPRPK